MTTYQLQISLLSPIHIGKGEELRADFDFIRLGNNTVRLNEDAILESFADRFKPDQRGNYPLPGQILRQVNQETNPKYHRYLLRGATRSTQVDARLQACIKDVYDNPYLPGSSIKGALRTAVAWTGWDEKNVRVNMNSLERRKEWAGQKLERDIFGKNPNHDLFRALQVSDCHSDTAREKMVITNVQVLTRGGAGSPIELEAVAGDVVFTGTLKIDDFLFSKTAEPELHFSQQKHWLTGLMTRVQQHSQARLAELAEWFKEINQAERVHTFISQLSKFTAGKHQALAQIGWGTGWDGKTFWTHLTKNEYEYQFEQILEKYRMVRGKRQQGDDFPKSRRVAMASGKPFRTFGWCLLELKEQ